MNKYWKDNISGKHIEVGDFNFEFNLPYDSQSANYRFVVEGVNSWDDIYNPKLNGIWQYSSVYPVCKATIESQNCIACDELSTPIDMPEIAQILNVRRFIVFPCINGLSGTFKDIEAGFVIGKIKEWGCPEHISFHSTGNTARAYREYAIKNGITSVAFIPLSCVNKMIGASADERNKLFLFNGPFQKISAYAKQWAKENGHLHIAPLLWKVEGKTPLGYHIMHSVPETTHIVQTVAGGYGVLGVHQAINRLIDWGICRECPQFILFQLSGADSFFRFFSKKKDINEKDIKLQSNPFEPTLQSTNPLSTYGYVCACCEKTNSKIYSTEVPTIIKYADELIKICNRYSLPLSFTDEKSPFISYAGLRRYATEVGFKGDETISFILTGASERSGEIPIIDKIIQANQS